MGIATVPHTAKWGPYTFKDWLGTPEGQHWELINGNLVMTEERGDNSALAGEIYYRIRQYLDDQPLGIVRHNVAFQFPGIFAADRQVVVPDLCYIPNDALQKWKGKENFQDEIIPALMVEILSPSTRRIDLEDKREIYQEPGIQEYWIFDVDEENVRIFRFAENPGKPVLLTFDDTITTPLLPGFALEMPKIRRALEPPGQRRGDHGI